MNALIQAKLIESLSSCRQEAEREISSHESDSFCSSQNNRLTSRKCTAGFQGSQLNCSSPSRAPSKETIS